MPSSSGKDWSTPALVGSLVVVYAALLLYSAQVRCAVSDPRATPAVDDVRSCIAFVLGTLACHWQHSTSRRAGVVDVVPCVATCAL